MQAWEIGTKLCHVRKANFQSVNIYYRRFRYFISHLLPRFNPPFAQHSPKLPYRVYQALLCFRGDKTHLVLCISDVVWAAFFCLWTFSTLLGLNVRAVSRPVLTVDAEQVAIIAMYAPSVSSFTSLYLTGVADQDYS